MWPFPGSPEYVTTPPSPAPAGQIGGAAYRCERIPEPAPTRASTVISVVIRSPEIGDADRVVKGATIIVAAPLGATRYKLAFSPADPVVADDPILAFPIGATEPATGNVNGSPLAITPVWVRLGSASVRAGSIESTLIVVFE